MPGTGGPLVVTAMAAKPLEPEEDVHVRVKVMVVRCGRELAAITRFTGYVTLPLTAEYSNVLVVSEVATVARETLESTDQTVVAEEEIAANPLSVSDAEGFTLVE
jgi:hypothetical protein